MTDDANTKTHHQNIQSHIVNPSDVIYTRFDVKKMTLSETLTSVYENRNLIKAVFSSRRKKSEECRKVTVKPLLIKGEYIYQAEYTYEKKVIHKNFPEDEFPIFCESLIDTYRQADIFTESEEIQILASKPGNPRIRTRKTEVRKADLSHNRDRNYLIAEGVPCDFLIHLGVMTKDGQVKHRHYSKFRQINRFLETVDDVYDRLPNDRPVKIIDFGCGKSYLTFALYYYLHILRGRDVEITGLDLKEDVIDFCSRTACELGYDGLSFLMGDIADYKDDSADMVVTLHACDTATDFALINAVKWNTKVILSVPCCQHELFGQIENEVMNPMLRHGIIRDKFTELLTDGLRALKLEEMGYRVDMIEFTSQEHTAKNIMMRAVKGMPYKKKMIQAGREYEALKEAFGVHPAIDLMRKE